MRSMFLAGMVLVGCGSTSVPNGPLDALAGTNMGSNAGSNASTVDDVQCQPHTRTIVNADGTKTVSTSQFALVDSVKPGDTFWIERCDYAFTSTTMSGSTTNTVYVPYDQPCPSGATCTNSDMPFPTAVHGCDWSNEGQFLDGKLYIVCGSIQNSYTAQGQLGGTFTSSYSSIKIHH